MSFLSESPEILLLVISIRVDIINVIKDLFVLKINVHEMSP